MPKIHKIHKIFLCVPRMNSFLYNLPTVDGSEMLHIYQVPPSYRLVKKPSIDYYI